MNKASLWSDPFFKDWVVERLEIQGFSCYYCNGRLGRITPDNIHHVLEKRHYPHLTKEPDNLRLIGGRFDPCNCHGKCHSANPTEAMKEDKRRTRELFGIADLRDKGL